jgi:polyhydroxyalkanoate synthesis regulator protein
MQIIMEQETQDHQLLPIKFLRQLIRFYGDAMQLMIRCYLEIPIESSLNAGFLAQAHVSKPTSWVTSAVEDQVRQNMRILERALTTFSPAIRIHPKAKQ